MLRDLLADAAVRLWLDRFIDLVIPRGGESLIRYVAENSTIPVIKHYKGVCFVYVDEAADLARLESLLSDQEARTAMPFTAVALDGLRR